MSLVRFDEFRLDRGIRISFSFFEFWSYQILKILFRIIKTKQNKRKSGFSSLERFSPFEFKSQIDPIKFCKIGQNTKPSYANSWLTFETQIANKLVHSRAIVWKSKESTMQASAWVIIYCICQIGD